MGALCYLDKPFQHELIWCLDQLGPHYGVLHSTVKNIIQHHTTSFIEIHFIKACPNAPWFYIDALNLCDQNILRVSHLWIIFQSGNKRKDFFQW